MQNFSGFYNTECCRIQPQEKKISMPVFTDNTTRLPTLDFTQNWNGKLFNDHFNELTIYSGEYRPGTKMEVMLNSANLGVVKIEAVRNFSLSALGDLLSYLNIGKPLHYQAELLNRLHGKGKVLLPDTMLTHMVCGWEWRNMENQNLLITEWWAAKQNKYPR